MKPTERYLRSATRGLWGQAKRELRQELHGHLQVRIQEWRLGGLSETEAERQTLRELGAPEEVRTGMLGVYTLPALGRGGLASLLMASLLIGILPQGQAQVSSIFAGSTQQGAASYLDFTQLQREFQKSGAALAGTPQQPTLTVPGAPRSPYPVASFPGSVLKQEGKTYLQTDALVNALLNSGSDLRLSGWTNPTLQAGKIKIGIQTTDWRVSNQLYGATLYTRPELGLGLPLTLLEPNGDTQDLTLTGNFQTGKVYALVMPLQSDWTSTGLGGEVLDRGNLMLTTNIAVAKPGRVTFRMYSEPARHVQPVTSLDGFHDLLDPLRKATTRVRWSSQQPAPALVLALSGHFGPDAYQVLPGAHVLKP
ncbi:permease prefix domain 1-containing protein [Deinococcus sp. QL22]|uniref:permease prefix domain 1-containing protein n=1 Tax=Deinococcus sp. QL22 TaxID=2939437 RepID=UPI0020181885|nr:permease prefix domain 1-containing protein [Deinococcus sp. QL22]UQN08201.1 permease prefix domain 1-containing protein [Deinococcus sp. QL22]